MEPTIVALTIIFKGPSALKSAACFLGLVESVEGKHSRLAASEYEAGIRHLREITDAPASEQFLLQEAWKRFAAAIAIERGERKALAYIGLAFAQYHLNEKGAANSTLRELLDLEFLDKSERVKRNVMLGSVSIFSLLYGGFITIGTTLVAGYHWLNSNNERAAHTLNAPYVAYAMFIKAMQTVPSEERVSALMDQVAAFLRNEGSMPNPNP